MIPTGNVITTDELGAVPIITRAELAKLECNRCGACCERFSFPSPLEIAVSGRLNRLAKGEVVDSVRTALWIGELEPLEIDAPCGGYLFYGCPRLAFDTNDGRAVCTAYDARPETCRQFPNSGPAGLNNGYFRCSFNVVLAEDIEWADSVQKYLDEHPVDASVQP